MTRSCFLSFTTSFSRTVALTAMLSGALFSNKAALADEFSLLPSGDPAYAQLNSLARPTDSKISSSLTRYEAALQAARSIMDVQNRSPKSVTRSQWRAVKALSASLKTELRQLGVDIDEIQALADRNLKSGEFKASDLPAPAPKGGPTRVASSLPRTATPRGGLLMTPGLDTPNVKSNSASIPLTSQLRLGTTQLSTERTGNNATGLATGTASSISQNLASETSVAYDFNRWLTLRAATFQSRLDGRLGGSPILDAPLFVGATQAKGTGGGMDINLSPNLKVSTVLERLRANNGAAASSIGGGATLSTNGLSMFFNMARVQPEDATTQPSTSAQFGVGLDVSQRLRLSLLYQSLFAQSANSAANNESRVSGGVSLTF